MASDPMEFRGLLPFLRNRRKIPGTLEWTCGGTLNAHEVVLAAHGVGWKRAAEAVDGGCSAFPADAVISTGFCGALDPELRIADAVVATCVAGLDRRYGTLPVESARRYAAGAVASIDHVARTAAEKRKLRELGAAVVEMEAAGVASRAEARGLPFYCVRAITDLASEDMANDFNAALRPDGHFDTMLIFRQALRHPVARLPELIRLRQYCERAARTLGEFFADCRF